MLPDRYHHATSFDGQRLFLLSEDRDNDGKPALALRFFDFGFRGSNVATAYVVPFWVYLDLFVADCQEHGVEYAARVYARRLDEAAVGIHLNFVEEEAFQLLRQVGERKVYELPVNVARRARHRFWLRTCFGLYLLTWAALVAALALQ